MRIGLIADTHMPGSQRELWPQVLEAFHGVEGILHAGDLHTLEVVTQLQRVAATWVARGNGDLDIRDNRVKDNWVLQFGNVNIGMIHRVPSPQRRSEEHLAAYTNKHFGTPTPLDVVIYGHTHYESMYDAGDCLYVNPGSPTLPRNQSLRLGTIGLLDLEQSHVTATILQLTEQGVVPHPEIPPIRKAVRPDSV